MTGPRDVRLVLNHRAAEFAVLHQGQAALELREACDVVDGLIRAARAAFDFYLADVPPGSQVPEPLAALRIALDSCGVRS